jgi:hypothetical protein
MENPAINVVAAIKGGAARDAPLRVHAATYNDA